MRKIQKINSNLFCSFQKMSAASKNILMASLAYNMWVMLERLDKIDDKENNIKIQSVLFSISTRARVTSHFSIFLSYKKNCRHLINHWLSLYYSQGFALNHHCQFSFFSTSCHAMIFVYVWMTGLSTRDADTFVRGHVMKRSDISYRSCKDTSIYKF